MAEFTKLIPNFGRESPVFNALKFLINFARLMVDQGVVLFCSIRPKAICAPNTKKRLLIIKAGAIGDVIILSGILPHLRNLYPAEEWEITLLAAGAAQHLTDFFNLGVLGPEKVLDAFVPINERKFSFNLLYRVQMQLAIARIQYDLVLCPTLPRLKDESQILFVTQAQQKIGFGSDHSFLNLNPNHHQPKTQLLESLAGWLKETDRNAHFIKMLGCPKEVDGVPDWQLPTSVLQKAQQRLQDLGIETPIVVICPGAAYDFRVWPPQKMAIVIDYLWEQYGLTALICGSPTEQAISQNIQAHLKSARPICLCGKTNLIELGALMRMSRLAITMDSAPAHLAVAVQAEMLCIIGGGHYQRFFPYGDPSKYQAVTEELDCFYCDWTCQFDRPICVENISVATVLQAVDLRLQSTSSVPSGHLNI